MFTAMKHQYVPNLIISIVRCVTKELSAIEIKTVGKLFIILISIQQQCYILCNVAVYIILEGQVHRLYCHVIKRTYFKCTIITRYIQSVK